MVVSTMHRNLEPRALVIGANGQDGSLIVEHLSANGWTVWSIGKQSASIHQFPRYISVDLNNLEDLRQAISMCDPDLIVHAAAVHGAAGFRYEPVWLEMMNVNVNSLQVCLEHARCSNKLVHCIYLGSAKIFGKDLLGRVDEATRFSGNCLYSAGKIAAYNLCEFYRLNHGLTINYLILFNHESKRRTREYFSRIIAGALHNALEGKHDVTKVHSLNFYADWSRAEDLAECVLRLARLKASGTFLFASGRTHYARGFVDALFSKFDLCWMDFVEEQEPKSRINSFFSADITALRSTLNFSPNTDTEALFCELAGLVT